MAAAAKQTPGLAKALLPLYRRHEAWARRSGYAPMEWADFKRSRLANPLTRAVLAAKEQA